MKPLGHVETREPNSSDPNGVGRGGAPPIGPVLKGRVPPWIHGQLDALRDARRTLKPLTPRSDVMRDVLRVGLVTLYRDLNVVGVPGFNPAKALIEAKARGEPV